MLKCIFSSPDKTDVYDNIESLILPSVSGETQVLPGYAESFILLGPGDIILGQKGGTNKKIPVLKGECYIKNNQISIIL